jgi:NAD(P)-dependent dehydrogenase (short-subunit alcohol dehydrogenase family)
MSAEDYDAVVKVHQYGTFNCARHAAPHMKEAGYGRIINVTSQAGLRGNFGQTNYGSAKAAIMGLTYIWAIELGRYGITVNAMSPAGATRMTEELFARTGQAPPAEANPALNAPMVTWLASEEAAHVNGQILGRTDFAYTLYRNPLQIAYMYREGGWDVQGVSENFNKIFAQQLQPVGMAMPGGMEHKK